jgi:dTDP-4-amino-4,6-dideoxygalactose transaminase
MTMLSFHATKVCTTFEGGALVCADARTKQRIDFLKNFGHSGEVTVVAPGINGKLTEIQAAFGLLQLAHIDEAVSRRRAIDCRYRERLSAVAGITLAPRDPGTIGNHSYFPIFVGPEYPLDRDTLHERLRQQGIVARRYFYPLVAEFPMYRGLPSASLDRLPVATAMSRSVLCLPIYPDLDMASVDRIAGLVAEP